MRLSSHGPRARAEFRRLVVESQIGITESELAHRRSRHQWFRARRVERRLAELRELLRDLDGVERTRSPSWIRSRFVGRVASVVWLVGAALLGTELVRNGLHTVAATVGIVAMLALSLLWFVLAVARVPFSAPEQPEAADPSHPAQPG